MNKLLTSLTVSMALLAAGPALSQQSPKAADQGSGYSQPSAAGTQDTNFNDEQLRNFVEAQQGITEIRDEYMAKIEKADSQEKAQELQMEANDEMVTVI